MNRRRKLLVAFGAGALIAPFTSFAQKQGRGVYRIGFIWPSSASVSQPDINAIMERLRELGHIQGRDFVAEYRWADGSNERLSGLAAELVRLKVDLIVVRSTPAAIAAKAATRDIPIIFSMVSDPVATDIVASLARPGGNMTGWSNMLPETSGKLLQLIKEAVPRISRVAVLWDPTNAGKVLEIKEMKRAAGQLGLALRSIEVRTTKDVEAAFAGMVRERPDALIALSDSVTNTHRQSIVTFTVKNRLPAIFQIREYVDAGGLMSYGLNVSRQYGRTAEYVDKIFKGAKPADLPVEQPTKFELVINGKTAKALGLKIPQSLLISAEKVIE